MDISPACFYTKYPKSINQELKSYLDSALQDSTDSNCNFTNEGYVFHILSDFVSDESRLEQLKLKIDLIWQQEYPRF